MSDIPEQRSRMEGLEVSQARKELLEIIKNHESRVKEITELILKLESELESTNPEGGVRKPILEAIEKLKVIKEELEDHSKQAKEKLEELSLKFLERSSPEGPVN